MFGRRRRRKQQDSGPPLIPDPSQGQPAPTKPPRRRLFNRLTPEERAARRERWRNGIRKLGCGLILVLVVLGGAYLYAKFKGFPLPF